MTIQTIGVLGAGQMGGGIAQVAAAAGYDVRLCDATAELAKKGIAKIDAILEKQVQKGKMAFVDHTVFGAGELHRGFDVQWFSGVTSMNSPRMQINYRFADSLADIDLDVAVWIWGFIPNPVHLSYAGSDTRQYFGSYSKRYGNPGYRTLRRMADSGRAD